MGVTKQARKKSELEAMVRRNQIHLAFFAFAAARRDLVQESWTLTAFHFKKRFNLDEEIPEETLIRACSNEIAHFISHGL